MGLLDLRRYLTPDFSAYQHSALSSPYPHNGVIADMTHEQGGLVGYVHPFDTVPAPEREQITNALPADVALGKVDYIEVVGFADHKATAEVWYKLLNLGFRVPTGAGTDAMANYASLRGPVGMNRVYLNTGGSAEPEALHAALKQGRTFASNGPQLASKWRASRRAIHWSCLRADRPFAIARHCARRSLSIISKSCRTVAWSRATGSRRVARMLTCPGSSS